MTPGDGHPTRPHQDDVDERPSLDDLRTSPTPLRVTLGCSNESPGAARLALRRWLDGWRCPSALADDVILAASELVMNAVVHATSPPCVTAVVDECRLRIEVHDESGEPPRLRDDAGAGGYGLHVVAAMADDWGWSTTASGKVVWTEHHGAHPSSHGTPTAGPRRR